MPAAATSKRKRKGEEKRIYWWDKGWGFVGEVAWGEYLTVPIRPHTTHDASDETVKWGWMNRYLLLSSSDFLSSVRATAA